MSKTVEIANPLPDGMRYTSPDRARNFERRQLGMFLSDGTFYFYENTQAERTEEVEFARNRGGVVFWNGSDRNEEAKHRPGEVRS